LADGAAGAIPWAGSPIPRIERHEEIEEAVGVLTGRRDGFLDLPRYRWAWEVVDGAVGQVDAYHRAGLAWASGEMRLDCCRGGWEDLQEFYRRSLGGRAPSPRVVGVSLVASTQVPHGMAIARIASELYPSAQVVLGGAQVTCRVPYLEDYAHLFDGAHWLVAYDGEEALEAICQGGEPGHIANAYFMAAGTIRPPPEACPVDIASTPPPSYEDLPLSDYLSPHRVLYLQGSRGCYWARCTFCPIHRLSLRYQARPGARVAADMVQLGRLHDVRRFYFVDEVLSPRFLGELAGAIDDEGLDVEWEGEARLEPTLDRDLVRRVRKAGCRKLFFGLESGSPRVLDRMQKGVDLRTASQVLEACFLEDIAVGLFCILSFPGERRDDLTATLGFILQRAKLLDRPGLSVDFTAFRLFRPARVAEDPARFGIEILSEDSRSRGGLLLPFREPGGPSEAEKAQMKAAVDRTLTDGFQYLLPLHEPDDLVYLGMLGGECYPRLVRRRDLSTAESHRWDSVRAYPRPSFHWEMATAGQGDYVLVPDTYTGRLEPATREEVELLQSLDGTIGLESSVATFAAQSDIPPKNAKTGFLRALKRTMAYGRAYLLEEPDRAPGAPCTGDGPQA
jgi:hypothetical protein